MRIVFALTLFALEATNALHLEGIGFGGTTLKTAPRENKIEDNALDLLQTMGGNAADAKAKMRKMDSDAF